MTPKTRWTLAIVGLLAGNVLAMTTLATVANVGHSEVIPDYYDQSTRYDDTMAAAAASRALGWRVEATLVDGSLSVAVHDGAGAPLAGATVRASGYPRAHAHERFDVPLVARGPGPISASPTACRASTIWRSPSSAVISTTYNTC